MAFRVRLGADTNPSGFKTAFFIGIDANADGALDLFLGVNNSGQADTIGIWSPGTGLNISPSTTTIGNTPLRSYAETSANYSWMPVNTTNDPSVGTDTDLDGGGRNDYFLSFSIAFSDVVAEMTAAGINGFNQDSPISFVIATSTQGNSLNQDLNGVGATFDPAATWSTLGVVSGLVTSTGTPIPEPSSSLLLMIGLGGIIGYRARRFLGSLIAIGPLGWFRSAQVATLCFWLLLREAVECAKAPDQFTAVYRHHLARRKRGLYHLNCRRIARIGKGRKEHATVRDVKVRVARGQHLVVADDFRRHRQFENLQRFAADFHRA